MTDPYQVLGISPNATDEQVKAAYRELSRKYHPDSYANNPLAGLAEEKFKEVQTAYTQIMDMREKQKNGQNYGGQAYNGQPYNQQGFGGQPYNPYQQQYQNNSAQYGRTPGNYNGGGCGTGNLCCDLWCADSCCECMGGDLCSCF